MLIKILKYWKSILVTATIFYLSFAQPSSLEKLPKIKVEHFDKLVHLALYFGLTLVLLFEQRKNLKKPGTIILSVLYPIVLGGLIEIAQQTWFSPRTGEWLDWLADVLGVLLAALIVFVTYKLRAKV